MARYNLSIGGCSVCICRSCLHYIAGDCPNGGCYDDLRARIDPYTLHHTGTRKSWSEYDKPFEQEHWCRGGSFYDVIDYDACEHYEKYTGQKVRQCLMANIQEFQNGQIRCAIVESVGCEDCYRRYIEKLNREEKEE